MLDVDMEDKELSEKVKYKVIPDKNGTYTLFRIRRITTVDWHQVDTKVSMDEAKEMVKNLESGVIYFDEGFK